MKHVKRFGLLALAVCSVPFFVLFPTLVPYAPRFHVLCMIVALLLGRACLRDADLQGWLCLNLAVFAHVVLLLVRGIAK